MGSTEKMMDRLPSRPESRSGIMPCLLFSIPTLLFSIPTQILIRNHAHDSLPQLLGVSSEESGGWIIF